MRAAWLALLLIVPAFVGCIGDTGETVDPTSGDDPSNAPGTLSPEAPDRSFVDAIDPNHADHHLPQLHQNSHGLEQVGHQDFADFYPPNYQGGWGEVDVHEDLAAVASVDGPLGVTLVDISDPASPEPLSYITSWGGDFDARFTDDGRYLVFGCQVGSVIGQGSYVAGDCKGNTGPHAPTDSVSTGGLDAKNSIVVYDVSDPENPERVAYAQTQAAHNVYTRTVNGTYYMLTNDVEIFEFQPNASEDERLTEVANVQGTHDVAVKKHPITGDWLLYTGSPKDSSVAIYEVNDPTNPSPLVQSVEGVVGWHEQTPTSTVIDGRVLLFGGGETFTSTGDAGDAPRQKITVVDVTDPENPEKLSEWQLPVSMQLPYANYRYSAHNIDVTPYGQVATSWYHGGVWVFDVSTQDRQEDPATLGFYQPHEMHSPVVPATFAQLDHAMVPLVWGGQWTDQGHLVLGDLYTGVYTLEPSWGLYPTANATAS